MSVNVANVQTSTDSFQIWIDKTNILLDIASRLAVTTEANTSGGQTTGNAHVNGFFSANLLATNTLRGGNVANSGNLTITSNTSITGANLHTSSNVAIVSSNVYINALNFSITGGIANLNSNMIVNGNTLIISSNNVIVNTDVDYLLIQTANVTYAPGVGGKLTVLSDLTIDGTIANVSSNVSFTGQVDFAGDLTVSGSITVDNDTRLGLTPASKIFMTGVVNTSIIPAGNSIQNLGSTTNYWDNIYVTNLNAGSIQFTGSLTDIQDISARDVLVGNTVSQRAVVNTNIGTANTGSGFTPVPIFSVPIADMSSAKLLVTTYTPSINTFTTSEMIVLHDGATPRMTVYGTLTTNTAQSANAGDYSVAISNGQLQVLFTQAANTGNTNIKVSAFLTKPF